MDEITDHEYEIKETLHDSDNSMIFRAKHNSSGNEVVLKQSKNVVKAGLYNEYNLIKEDSSDNNIFLLTQRGKIPSLVRKFYPGNTLRSELQNNKPGLDFFFSCCFMIIEELQKIHLKEIIHKDLSPENILIDHENNAVHIIDFELSTKQQFQNYAFNGASVIEGTLHYMSPEQTGRMNRVIDYRSDFYSLGVIFYEILSGKKPFESKDALELIHCHIAQIPPSLTSIAPELPQGLVDVINKLLSKNAEERYQSLSGLIVDLEHCQKQWKTNGKVASFELAKADLPLRLNVSQRLIGREKEMRKIFSLFDDAAAGKKVLLELKGLSGIGKTMLIRETARPLTSTKGTYISGKFDSQQKTVPYYAWTQALDQLADLLLTENEESISMCKQILADNMQGLEPEIEAIAPKWKIFFGDLPPLPVLNPKEQQGRMLFAVSLFLKNIMKITQPLLFFLDDWQWADEASVELLKSVAGDEELGKLFLALAYRPNETNSTHSFIRVLNEIKRKQSDVLADGNLFVETIELKPLTPEESNEILSETFSCSKAECKDLGELIYSKTLGNPFFVNQLLDFLYNKNHIRLDPKEYKWKWNLKDIANLAITEDIATVIIEKIKDISPQTLEALMYASCLGNIFSLSSLNYITKTPKQQLHTLLWEAIKENILEPLEKDYKFVPEYYEANKHQIKFKFTHDRIQQALYARADGRLREEMNFNAAEFEIAHPEEAENVFTTANHLIASGTLINNRKNKKGAAGVLLEAGEKAFASAAYEAAFVFLSLFDEIAYPDYKISIDNRCLLITAAYLNNREDKALECQKKAFGSGADKIERAKIYEAILKGTIAMAKLKDALAISRTAFEELGFKLPKTKATTGQIIWSAIKTQIAFPDKKIKDIGKLPDMTDATSLALMRLMYNSLAAYFFAERDTYPLIIFNMVRLSKKMGNAPESIIGYGSYGLILAGVLNKPDAGYAAGKEAMKLFDKFNAEHLISSAGFVDTYFISHWKEPMASYENDSLIYYQNGMKTGNLEYAAWNLYAHSNSLFFRGTSAKEISDLYTDYEKFYLNHKQMNAYGASKVIKNGVNKLLVNGPIIIADTEEEKKLFDLENKANNTVYLFVYNSMKCFLGALHNQYPLVLENAHQNHKDIENAASLYWQPFFRALKTVIYVNSAFEGKLDYNKVKKELVADRKKLKIANAAFEGNVGWIIDFIDAEREAYEKKNVNHALYDSARIKAIKNEFNFPAILIELMRVQKMKYLNAGGTQQIWDEVKEKLSASDMQSVIFSWEQKYPELKGRGGINTSITQTRGKMTSEDFDVQTVIKTTQALSSEIVLAKLIDKMMQFAMENAGARYGCFMIKRDGTYSLASEKFADGSAREGIHDGIPTSIFNYVNRTGEPLILDNAIETAPYNKDPKVMANSEKSVLCLPIIFQNASIGMIYLTNQLSKAVFTEQRIGILKMLAGQIGVSLQNAILYENMEKLVATRTAQVVEQKNLIEKSAAELASRHKEITDSINYAERIQRALLASQSILDENLPEYFVLFKPKDVVSGDFYWATKLLNNNFMLVTADSTGHGVAGAIMSIVNISCIKEAVSKDLLSPDLLMNEIRRLVIQSLKNDGSAEGGKDGMDASLIIFDFKNQALLCACAINPVWIIRGDELIELKVDRFPIGKHDMNKTPFSLQTISLQKGDLIYTMTDGFADQFGGPKGKKFMYKQMKTLLQAISHEPMEKQKDLLDRAFMEWKGDDVDQIDDVTVVGIRI